MNVTIMSGRFVADPECLYGDDTTVKSVRFSLAVKRDFVLKNGVDTDFFQCVAFKNQAKFIESYVRKGNKVIVRGRFQNNNYEKDGQKVYAIQFIVDSVEPCESKKSQEEFQPVGEQELPFDENGSDVTAPETSTQSMPAEQPIKPAEEQKKTNKRASSKCKQNANSD